MLIADKRTPFSRLACGATRRMRCGSTELASGFPGSHPCVCSAALKFRCSDVTLLMTVVVDQRRFSSS